jgi:hypothetical protein
MSAPDDARYFFIIGAMKAGTTSLFKYLAGHPDLCPSKRKEPRVFRDPGDPAEQRAALGDLFDQGKGQLWRFEGSTAYTKYPKFTGVPERIQRAVPDARFIYLVRNPVERTWSQYIHNLAHGRETRPFARAIEEKPQYLNFSRYHLQLQEYLAVFPKERILLQVFEDMVADPAAVVRSVCEFLGVDTSYRPATAKIAYNASSAKRTASMPLRALQTLGLDRSVPWRVRQRLRTAGDPLPERRAVLTTDTRRIVADALRPDTEAFFTEYGRRIGAWSDFNLTEGSG